MRIKNYLIKFRTKATFDFIDTTNKIQELIERSGVKTGIINIQSLHTTMAILVNESEPLLIDDMKKTLERVASQKTNYRHDDFTVRTVNMCEGECQNGHSHCKAIFLPTSILFNVFRGGLQLGQWQRIFAVELDRARHRKIAVQIMGK
jgi:secondary thiamine-phosphate synthase enzyme